jgi:hypothetical protein
MKYLLLILLCCTSAYAQQHKIPDVPFNSVLKKKSEYFKTFDIKDRNALIVTAGTTGYREVTQNFLVYSNKGPVRKFILTNRTEVQEIAVTDEQQETYWQFLYNYFNGDLIDREKLTGRKSTIVVLDGSWDYFIIYSKKKSYALNSHSSEVYINAKSDGWEERVKLLDLIKRFDEAFLR